jgi:anti-sigma factor RsiW
MTESEYKCPEGWDSDQLWAYAEGELEAPACRTLETHLNECSACAGELESLKELRFLLKKHPDPEALYWFITAGKDSDGKLAAHLASCERCRVDAEIFQEMIAEDASIPDCRAEAIGSSYEGPRATKAVTEANVDGVVTSGRTSTDGSPLGEEVPPPGLIEKLVSWMKSLEMPHLGFPFLALGSAAAVAIVVIVTPSLWQSPPPNPLLVTSEAPELNSSGEGRDLPRIAHVNPKGVTSGEVGLRTDRPGAWSLDGSQSTTATQGQRLAREGPPSTIIGSEAGKFLTSPAAKTLEQKVQSQKEDVAARLMKPPPTLAAEGERSPERVASSSSISPAQQSLPLVVPQRVGTHGRDDHAIGPDLPRMSPRDSFPSSGKGIRGPRDETSTERLRSSLSDLRPVHPSKTEGPEKPGVAVGKTPGFSMEDQEVGRAERLKSFQEMFPEFGEEEFALANDDLYPDWKKHVSPDGTWLQFLAVYKDFVQWWEKGGARSEPGFRLWKEFVARGEKK